MGLLLPQAPAPVHAHLSKSASRHAWLRPVFGASRFHAHLGLGVFPAQCARVGQSANSCSRHSVMCLRSLGRILGKSEVFDCWSLSLLWGLYAKATYGYDRGMVVWGYPAPMGLDGMQPMPFNRGPGRGSLLSSGCGSGTLAGRSPLPFLPAPQHASVAKEAGSAR